MKKLILILALLFPFIVNGQDYRVIDWKTDVLNVQTINTDTFKFETEIKDYNDAGAITREIGNYFIDYVARCFKIIDSDANTITVVDLEHINLAPQSNKIGRVYQSIVDADSIFKSIGGVDISVLDDLSRWKDVARNNELFGRKIKELDGRDTTGIYHANRELLNSITPEDTTRWATGGLITETDPTVSALVKSIDATDTTYWGRAETDPTISAWAKAATKPTYTYSEVGAQPAGSYATTTQLANQLSQTITNGVTTKAPSEDAVFDALAGKQNTITNPIIGVGIENIVPFFLNSNTVGNSFIQNNAIGVGIGISPKRLFHIGLLGPPTFAFTDSRGTVGNQTMGFLFDAGIALSKPGIVWQKLSDNAGFVQNLFTFFQNGTINFDGIAYPDSNAVVFGSKKIGAGTNSPAARIHSQSTTTQLRLGYDATKYTDLATGSTGNLTIDPTGDTTKVVGAVNSTGGFFKNGVEITGGGTALLGTVGYIPIITGNNTLGNSMLYDNGGNLMSSGSLFINKSSGVAYNYLQSPVTSTTGVNEVAYFVLNNTSTADKVYVGLRKNNTNHEYIQSIFNASSNMWLSFGNYNYGTNNYIAYDGVNNVFYKNNFTGFGTSPSTKVHVQSTTTQLRLGYDATKYTDLSTNSAGTFNISPSGGFTNFSGGISASAFSTFTGQVEMTGLDVNLGASTVLRKNGSDIFTAPITMGACGSAGQVLTSTGLNSAPTWTTPATGSGSGITSIGIQVPTGLTVSPASLTANGTFTIGLQSGYSIPTTANQTNWSTAYSQRLISVSASYPMYLSLTNNVLTGYLNNTLTNFGGVVPSVGYPYWNGSNFSYQAATTTYTLPTASNSTLGGIQVSSTDGGLAMSGNFLLQKDNALTARTPVLSDPIAFYDASATAQGQTTFAEIRTIMNGVQTLTSSSSITMNFATAPKASLSLGTNGTITITNVPDGSEGSIEVTSSGAYTLAIAGSTGYTTTQKMGTVAAIASSAHTTVFYWRSGTVLYYGFLLNN